MHRTCHLLNDPILPTVHFHHPYSICLELCLVEHFWEGVDKVTVLLVIETVHQWVGGRT